MKNETKNVNSDEIDDLLKDYHQFIRHHYIQKIDDDQMRQKIIMMAENNLKSNLFFENTSDNFDLNNSIKSPLNPIIDYKQNKNKSNYIQKIISYDFIKVASWILIISGVLFTGSLSFYQYIYQPNNPDYFVNNQNLPSNDKSEQIQLSSQVFTEAELSQVQPKVKDEMDINDLFAAEIVLAEIEPNRLVKPQDINELDRQKNKVINLAGDFNNVKHTPSIKIRIEQAPVLPAGSISDPNQIEIDNSI